MGAKKPDFVPETWIFAKPKVIFSFFVAATHFECSLPKIKTMKIALDATAFYGRFGGIENALWQTLRALSQLPQGNEFHIFVPQNAPQPFPEFPNHWNWRRLPFRGVEKARRIWWQQTQFPLLLRREKFELLHAPTYVMPLFSSVPTVLGVPDLIALNAPRFATRANRLHYRAILPQSLKRAARVIVTTPRVEKEVCKRAPSAQIRVVLLGVESEFLNPISAQKIAQIRARYALPDRFLLYVGNLEPKKNLPNLIRAVEMLGENAPPLVIAGGIKPWPELEKWKTRVRFLGFLPREELAPLYASCAVFCFPSLCEGFGLPVLEALACGAKVVASQNVPLPNLESVAFAPNPHFPRAIKNAIETALAAPFSQKGRDYAREFTWENTARQTLAVYRELGAD